jgi:hypothetical protein
MNNSNFNSNSNFDFNYSDQSINNSFKPNEQFVSKRDFQNKNDLLVNNIGQNVVDQKIRDYIIDIDSTDRDYKLYPNPFDYVVTFNAKGDTIEKGVRYKGTPGPTIVREFENVKYIKLNNIILPRKYNVIKKHEDDLKFVYVYDSVKELNQERFVMLNIDEVDHDTVYTTNVDNRSPFGTIYNDKWYSPYYYYGITAACFKIYRLSELGNIKKLHIQILDSRGKQLKCEGLDNTVNTPAHCICDDNKYSKSDKEKCSCKYIRHPLNPKFQNFLSFTIGELDNTHNITPLSN